MVSLAVKPRSARADVVIFTDAAFRTGVIAVVAIPRAGFKADETTGGIIETESGKYWRG